MHNLIQDIRYAFRTLVKSPAYSIVAIATLALGIGANSAIFSVVNGVLLQPLPYAGDHRLVVLQQSAPQAGRDQVAFSVKEIEDYRSQSRTLEEVVEYHNMSFVVWGSMQAHQIRAGVVSANFFDVLGVDAHLGRTFLPGEDQPGTEPILVLSYEYWSGRLGADPEIIGKPLQVNSQIHTVVGVLPPIPQYPRQNDAYMPTSHCPTRSSPRFQENRSSRMMLVFGRLQPSATANQSRQEVASIARRMKEEHPGHYPSNSGFTASTIPLKEQLTRQARPTFLILLGASGLVLLIACANVANLALSRLLRREREMAIRSVLGARRGRLLRQTVTEGTLLALAGGGLGLALAFAGMDLLVEFAARFTPRAPEVGIDLPVLLFTLLVSTLVGIIFGILPAFQPREDLQAALSEGSARLSSGLGKQRLRSILVVAQVAVSLILLIGAGLMVRSFISLQSVDAGVNPEKVLSMRVGLNFTKFSQNEAGVAGARREFWRILLERVRALPGVQSAGLASMVPLDQQEGMTNRIEIEGQPMPEGQPRPSATQNFADPGYFQTVGIPLIRGRFFSDSDDPEAPPVAVITQSMARRYWGDRDPVGQKIKNMGRWMTVVGVVGDIREFGLDRPPTDEMFAPFAQSPFASRLVIRTTSDPMGLSQPVISIIRQIDPDQTVDSVTTLEEIRSESMAPARLTTLLAGLFSTLALLITATGLGGVMALMVNQRTHEIGVRRAVGARERHILRLILGHGLRLTLIGSILGLSGAFLLSRFLESLLFSVAPTDLISFLAMPLLLLAVAVAACYIPARRAIRVDPVQALCSE